MQANKKKDCHRQKQNDKSFIFFTFLRNIMDAGRIVVSAWHDTQETGTGEKKKKNKLYCHYIKYIYIYITKYHLAESLTLHSQIIKNLKQQQK